MMRSLIVGTFVLLSVAGCGKSEQTGAAGQAAPTGQSAPATGAAAGQAAPAGAATAEQGLQQMMQGLQQMSQGAQGQVKLVDYEVLKGLLPELSGWERTGAKGQQVSMGISVSSAEARYQKGDSSIKLEILDTSFSQIVLAPFMMFARAGYEEKSDDGYTKGMTLASYPGFETWKKANRDAEVHLLVGNRFLVNAEANEVDSAEPARELVQAVNLSKLAGLK